MPICPKCGDENPQLGAACPRDGGYYVYSDAIPQAERDGRIGTLAANKYVIVGRISKGGMGAVYRALQLPVEREVAFKVLRTELEDSNQGRDRFVREARAVSRLGHPNIITLYDFGFEQDGHPYMVMEYAPGKDMGSWLRTENLTLERVLHVVRQLLSALDEAHRAGIVHRDLKPENIIVTSTGSGADFIKLLDFGIARMINETSTRGLTREGEVFGTPHYMAPEQAQGAKKVGPPADVYAVGIMLFEMLTGEPPFDAPAPLPVLMMHINKPLPPVVPRPSIGPLPEAVEQLIARSTAKDVDNRYEDAGEMLAAIDQALGLVPGRPMAISYHGSLPVTDASAEGPARDTLNTPAPVRDPHVVTVVDPGTSGDDVRYDVSTQTLPPHHASGRSTMLAVVAGALVLTLCAIIVAVFMFIGGQEDATAQDQLVAEPTTPLQQPETTVLRGENSPPSPADVEPATPPLTQPVVPSVDAGVPIDSPPPQTEEEPATGGEDVGEQPDDTEDAPQRPEVSDPVKRKPVRRPRPSTQEASRDEPTTQKPETETKPEPTKPAIKTWKLPPKPKPKMW